MVLLMLFAFLAGAATAISPCALPVLPVVFAAGTTGGRKRPLGIATGLAVSFAFAVVALVYVISAFGLPDGLLRTFAIAVLLVFGLSLMVPKASAWVEYRIGLVTSRGSNKIANSKSRTEPKDGFWSGVLVGGGLGFVYAPCAGPILAGVITATASQDFSAGRFAVALSYGVGSAAMFYALMLGGRRLIAPLSKRSGQIQFGMGLAMVLVAIAMFANLDSRFQTAIAADLPSFLVNPTGEIERSDAVAKRIADTKGQAGAGVGSAAEDTSIGGEALPVLGVAPEFTDNQKWFNTAGGKPLTIDELRGKVVLVDFWTYTCINCIRTLPYIEGWYKKYAGKGLVVVGVHTPEFPFEKSASNVQSAINQRGLTYPVAQDNNFGTWDAYSNQYWPAKYLIDANGKVRYIHFGEGDYAKTETAIRSLLAEEGVTDLGSNKTKVNAQVPSPGDISPETYLGTARAKGFTNGDEIPGTKNYRSPRGKLPLNMVRFSGIWMISNDAARAVTDSSTLDLRFSARRVFLVLGAKGGPQPMKVLLDGKPISSADAGKDVKDGVAMIDAQRLYSLVDLPDVQEHLLTLEPANGIAGYAFTFG
jgi:cytochrome c biogenesis protein CcdA/thiol-disulfide isomerase/thioredoxin